MGTRWTRYMVVIALAVALTLLAVSPQDASAARPEKAGGKDVEERDEAKVTGKEKAGEVKAKGKERAAAAKEKAKEKGKSAEAKLKGAEKRATKMAKRLERLTALEENKHTRRQAKIVRIEELAKEKGNVKLLEKVAQMREQEKKRHDRALTRLAEKAAVN